MTSSSTGLRGGTLSDQLSMQPTSCFLVLVFVVPGFRVLKNQLNFGVVKEQIKGQS